MLRLNLIETIIKRRHREAFVPEIGGILRMCPVRYDRRTDFRFSNGGSVLHSLELGNASARLPNKRSIFLAGAESLPFRPRWVEKSIGAMQCAVQRIGLELRLTRDLGTPTTWGPHSGTTIVNPMMCV